MKAIILLLLFPFVISAQSALQGKVFDSESNEPILFGVVALIQNGEILKGVETDLDGCFYFSDISPGIYDLRASYVGYTPDTTFNVRVLSTRTRKIDLTITEGVLAFETVLTGCNFPPMIRFDEMESGAIITSEDIRNMPICK